MSNEKVPPVVPKEIIEKIKSKELSNKDFFSNVKAALWFSPHNNLTEVVSKVIQPNFKKRFPEGSIHFVQQNKALTFREAFTRSIMAEQKIRDIHEIKTKEEFTGYQSLRSLQSTLASQTLQSYLALVLLLFRPNAYGIFANKVNGFFVFLFGHPLDCKEAYPADFVSHFLPTDFLNLFKGTYKEEYKLYEDTQWTPEQYRLFFYSYIENLNNSLNYIYDASNFLDKDGVVDEFKGFNAIYTLNRISAETCILQTEYRTSLVSVPFTFAVLDKIANLIQQLNPSLTERNEAGIFRKLVCRDEMLKLSSIFDKYPKPFNSYLKKRLRRAFSDLNKKVIESIFLKKRVSGKEIVIDPKKPEKIFLKNSIFKR